MDAVKTLHPAITPAVQEEWALTRACMAGESAMKREGEAYLPIPSGFRSQDDDGVKAYTAYRERAQFPALLSPSVGAMIGIIHGQEIAIEMPDQMNYLWESANGMGLPLEAFHRRITRELLTIGGYGVLADADADKGGDPYLAGYSRDSIINWDTDWFVLDETALVRNGFAWEQVEKFRVLSMEGGACQAVVYEGQTETPIEMRGRGGKPLPRVPFAVANSLDLSVKIESPPLIGVSNAAKAIYQLSADYRHQLYMSGQETLVAINGEAPSAVGAGVVHEMRGGEGEARPDLKYVSPTCSGITAHKEAMAEQREAAVQAGARLFEQTAAGQESGEAKRLRYASETATLTTIAQSSCMLLERSLRNAAMIMGLPEDGIVVNAPADLMDRTMSPQDFAALFGVYADGGMSWETLHENGVRGGIYSTERTAEQEYELLDGPMGREAVA